MNANPPRPCRLHTSDRDRRRGGFTAAEVLVVSAIVGILVELLLPALCMARQRGEWAVCLGHVRELTFMTLAYAEDHDGVLPKLTDAIEGGPGHGVHSKSARILPYYFLGKGTPVTPLFLCPSEQRQRLSPYVGDYSYKLWRGQGGADLGRLTDHSSLPLIFCNDPYRHSENYMTGFVDGHVELLSRPEFHRAVRRWP